MTGLGFVIVVSAGSTSAFVIVRYCWICYFRRRGKNEREDKVIGYFSCYYRILT